VTEIDVATHEAGHALAGYYLGVPIKTVSVYSAPGEAGRCRFESGAAASSELDVATVFVAGRMAEKKALGHLERFNWFDDDVDTAHACDMVDAITEAGDFDGDVFEARHWVEVRAHALLTTKWKAVEQVAAKLRKSTVLTGDEVASICRAAGVRRLGEGRRAAPNLGAQSPQLAAIARAIAAVEAQLDQPYDDPSLWPLRKQLVALHDRRRELLDQLQGGTHRWRS
jgi:hypothetical protein